MTRTTTTVPFTTSEQPTTWFYERPDGGVISITEPPRSFARGPLVEWLGLSSFDDGYLHFFAAAIHGFIALTLLAGCLMRHDRQRVPWRTYLPAGVIAAGAAMLEPRLMPWSAGPPEWPTPWLEAGLSSLAGGAVSLLWSVISTGGDPPAWRRRMPSAVLVGLTVGWAGAVVVVTAATFGVLLEELVRVLIPSRRPGAADAVPVEEEFKGVDEAEPDESEAELGTDPREIETSFEVSAGPSSLSEQDFDLIPLADRPSREDVTSTPDIDSTEPLLVDHAVSSEKPTELELAPAIPAFVPPIHQARNEVADPFDGWLIVALLVLVAIWSTVSEPFATLTQHRTLTFWAGAGLLCWLAARWGLRLARHRQSVASPIEV